MRSSGCAGPWASDGSTVAPSRCRARAAASRLTTELDPEVEAHLRHLYGSRAGAVVERATEDASLLERLHLDGPDIAAQAVFAVECEWATSVEDILRRRTTVTLRGLADEGAVARVEGLLSGS
jgi:glycerol-3-phosphate dehydrogenase